MSERTSPGKENPFLPPAGSLQCAFLTTLHIVAANRAKIKGTGSCSQNKQLRLNLELENHPVTAGKAGETVSRGALQKFD